MHLAALLVVCHWLLVGQIGQMDKMDLMSEAVHLAASLSSACNMAMTSPFICRTDVGQIPEANGDQQGPKERTSRANRTRNANSATSDQHQLINNQAPKNSPQTNSTFGNDYDIAI